MLCSTCFLKLQFVFPIIPTCEVCSSLSHFSHFLHAPLFMVTETTVCCHTPLRGVAQARPGGAGQAAALEPSVPRFGVVLASSLK